jgi:hypothetical protein
MSNEENYSTKWQEHHGNAPGYPRERATMNNEKLKRKPGRQPKGAKMRGYRLTDETVAILRMVGDGNVTKGIEQSAKIAKGVIFVFAGKQEA